ncbi:MAG: hypothetical protein WDW38_011102 [Sanguina aurantia]
MTNSKEYIVTGGNSGIGFEVVKGLLEQPGSNVVMACRDMRTCSIKQAELQALPSTKGSCVCAKLDLEDLNSVRAFAAEQRARLQKECKTLSVLVNNAGVMGLANTPDTNADRHMAINHVGPFLLTKLLLPAMAKGARIVNVASRAHLFGSLHFDAQGRLDQHPSWWMAQYSRSKLANVLFTAELQQRVGTSQGINCYSVSPGAVNTPIFSRLPLLSWLAVPLASLVMRTPAHGARTVLYAALSPELEGKHVLFLHDEHSQEPAAAAKDPVLAERLWVYSETLVAPYLL